MKPIHHAMVSARLFGGNVYDYVDIHTKFDLSKSALGDMRHRAALHSVDHGGAVMEKLYANATWPGATTRDLIQQHMDDDQGFQVTLDDWLASSDVPIMISTMPKNPKHAAFLDSPAEACAARWGGSSADYEDVCAYYSLPEQFSNHPLAPAISRNTFAIFFSEFLFGPALSVEVNGKKRLVPTRDIGETLTMARYGYLPTLENVLSGVKRQDWMTGSRVAGRRKRRIRQTNIKNLFSEDME